jgi:hypothetical protein
VTDIYVKVYHWRHEVETNLSHRQVWLIMCLMAGTAP